MGSAKRVNTVGVNESAYWDRTRGDSEARLDAEEKALKARTAPMATAAQATGTGIDRSDDIAMREQQLAALGRLDAAARGEGPSIAGTQMQANTEAALRAQMAGAASARGNTNAALAMRQQANQAAQFQQAAALQSAQLKAQEAQAAQQAQIQALAATRGQDMQAAQAQANLNQQTALANAGFNQQTALANQQATLGMAGLNDAQMRALMGARFAGREADRQAWMQFARDYSAEQTGSVVPSQEKDFDRTARGIGAIGQVFTMGMSDERAKTDVEPGEGKVREFLKALGAHDYRYKDPDADGAGEGRFVSPMAQEIEKTEVGKSAVVEGADGFKRVDYAKLLGAMLAGESDHEKRIERLEVLLKSSPEGQKK